MHDKTKLLVNALIGLECEPHPEHPELDYPVSDIWEWDAYPAKLRFRWASLLALADGDEVASHALAELATAATVDEVGLKLNRILDAADAEDPAD